MACLADGINIVP